MNTSMIKSSFTSLFRFSPAVILAAAVLLVPSKLLQADDHPAAPQPPVAKKVPHTTEVNGRTLDDNYFWLRDKKNPEVAAYLQAENAYTDAVMKPTLPLQKKLYDEMLSRVKETDVEVPYKEGNYFYYTRTEAGKQYPIYCRKKGTLESPEELLAGCQRTGPGPEIHFRLRLRGPATMATLLAYTTDNTGFRQYTLAVKDLRTGKLLPDHAERVGSVAWANDNKTIFYTVEDPIAKREYQAYRHAAGTAGPDQLIYEEKDERFYVYVGKTRSKAFIFLHVRQPHHQRCSLHPRRSTMPPNSKSWNPASRTCSIFPITTATSSISASMTPAEIFVS